MNIFFLNRLAAVGTGYVLLVAGVWWLVNRFSLLEIQLLLMERTYLFLSANAALIVFAILLNSKSLWISVQKIPNPVRLALLAIVTIGILQATFTAPATHRIYYDEDIYQNIGNNLAHLRRAQMCNDGTVEYGVFNCRRGEYNKQPSGFPYLLAIGYQLFGTSERLSFIYNNLIMGGSLLVTFMIASRLFGGFSAGLFAALVLSLIPQNIVWHNTTAAEPSAALFGALVVLAALHTVRERSNDSLFLLATISAFTLHLRPESGLVLVPLLLILLFGWRLAFGNVRFYLFGLLFALLATPAFLHFWIVRNNSWGSTSTPFGLQYFSGNFSVNFWFYLENTHFPVLFTLLALAGIFIRPTWLERITIWVWFLLFWGVFLFFYAGSYNYGADVRYSLLSYPPLALLAGGSARELSIRFGRLSGRGTSKAATVIATFIIMAHIPFLPTIRAETAEAWAARADHHFALEMLQELPDNALVLSHNPGIFQLWGKNAAQASIAISEPKHMANYYFPNYKGGIFFHYNFWCNVTDPLQNSFCTQLLEKYPHEQIKTYQERSYHYGLYRLKLQ